MNNHSKFAFSKMHRRLICPGSAHIDNKNTASTFASEGTKAHEESAELLHNDNLDISNIKPKYDIMPYLSYINGQQGNKHIEITMGLSSISDDIYGTADCIIENWPDTLHVIDLKYGAGIVIDPIDNAQLIAYALSALEKFGNDFREIKCTIIQPRIEHEAGPVRSWIITPRYLQTIWYPKILEAYKKAIEEPNTYIPSMHCKWCSGIMDCPEAKKQTKSIIKKSEEYLNNKRLGKLLEQEQLILEYLNEAKTEAFKRLLNGEKIPGFKLIRNFGNTTWKDKKQAIKAFSKSEDAWRKELIAISKLKKLYPEKIEKYIHRPDKGLLLVPITDKRESYKSAITDFSD